MKKSHKIISTLLASILLFSCAQVLSVSAAETTGALPPPSVQFTNSLNWEQVYMYVWNNDGDIFYAWPGIQMYYYDTDGSGQEVYRENVPYDATDVIFSNGDNERTDFIAISSDSDSYYVHPEITSFKDDSQTIYVPIPKDFTVISCMIGDANRNGTINISDVTAIQRYLAEIEISDTFSVDASDVDKNGIVNIDDATLIQYYLAEFQPDGCNFGETFFGTTPEYTLSFEDLSNWGKVSVTAFDDTGRALRTSSATGEASGSVYSFSLPVQTFSFVVVSQDGTKRTEHLEFDRRNHTTYYVAWDKANQKYVLNCHEKNRTTRFEFVNTLGWENVCVTSWDKYGNVVDDFALESENDAKHTIALSFNAVKAVLSNGAGEETDNIFFSGTKTCLYYLIETKTTVNQSGKTVYRPIRYIGNNYPEPARFYFVNTLKWTDLHIYMWDDDETITAEWPGDTLTEFVGLNDFGDEVYSISVPLDIAGDTMSFIISGSGGQTADIQGFPFSSSNGGYLYLVPEDFTEFGGVKTYEPYFYDPYYTY